MAIVYDNAQTTNKFTFSSFERVSLFNQSHIAFAEYLEEVKEFAKEHDCENVQIKAFNRI